MHASSKMGMPGLQMKYFVLKPGGRTDYHRASRLAMLVYATEIRQENPVLAAELETWSYAEEKSAASAQEWAKDAPDPRDALLKERDAEIARLTQKLAAEEQRVAELESVDERGLLGTRISDLESEVVQLREDKRNTGNKPPRGPALQYANPSTYRIEPFELETEVARLTSERDEARSRADDLESQRESILALAEARVEESQSECEQKLAAAEQRAEDSRAGELHYLKRAQAAEQKLAEAEHRERHQAAKLARLEAAEARCRELEAEQKRLQGDTADIDRLRGANLRLESELAQLRERLYAMASDERACQCRQPDCFACELTGTREWLLAHGYHIVTAADMRVLKAMAEIPARDLRDVADMPPPSQRQALYRSVVKLCNAELARREGKP